jgi:hypothetical protein
MTRAESIHKSRVAAVGCALCHRIHGPHEPGPVELHHLRSGGWGKGSYLTLIPLCVNHHRGPEGIHHLGTKAFERGFQVTQQELLDWTNEMVVTK